MTSEHDTWSARCVETRTPGAAGGPGKRTGRKASTAPRSDPTGLSYRDVEELLAERGVEVDHTTLFRWVARFTLLFVEAARPTPGDRWLVDETYVKVRGRWRYLYRRSTSSARSSTCWRRRTGTGRRPGGSSPGRWPVSPRQRR